MTLFRFELKKLLFSKKTLAVLAVLAAFVILLFVRNLTFQTQVEKAERQAIDAQVRTSQANGRAHILLLEKDPDDEKQKELQTVNLEIRDPLYDLAANFSHEDWKHNLEVQNGILETTLTYKELGGESPLSVKEIERTIAQNNEFLKRGIRPEHSAYSIAVPNFLQQIVSLWMYGGGLLLVLLLAGDTLTSEYESQSVNLLFTQPIRKAQWLLSKLGAACVAYVLALFVALITAAAVSSLFGDKGSFRYPVLIEKDGSPAFGNLGVQLIEGIIITSVLALLVISLILLYSLYAKKTLPVLAAVLGTLGAGYGITKLFDTSIPSWLNPFLNLFSSDLLHLQNGRTWYEALPITLVAAIVLVIAAIREVRKSRLAD
ncbi:ABC transporter permease subunit [Sporosarcina sp. D27]|uniref:ABC transporter permease subunit n=1 Tax=Sporosarcina sp. D27 TaxID=1382305 RepID=UPI0004725FB0|nr:ABC transporter permease subunit [Sporosarcina sp. D27]